MDNVSRPLIALLVGTVALFALYFVALRGSSTQGTDKQSLQGFKSDISAAHQAAATAARAGAAAGGNLAQPSNAPASTSARTPSTATTQASKSSQTDASKAEARHAAKRPASRPAAGSSDSTSATQHRLNLVSRALEQHKVLALLFYNPAASDDRAVKQELATVPTERHRVVKLAVPIGELAKYQVVDTQVPVNETPTLVLIDRNRQATTIVGFASGFEIAQRVADAVAIK